MTLHRSDRLVWLVDRLGRSATPATRDVLCAELQITPRLLADDIVTLVAEGTPIIGDARRGYLLHPAHSAPTLRFSATEKRALTLGLQALVGPRDPVMDNAKRSAQAKLMAAMTMEERAQSLYLALWLADPADPLTFEKLTKLRTAIRDQVFVTFNYLDLHNNHTSRRVKPVALDWRGASLHLAAWCETRHEFRRFILDRIGSLTLTTQRFQPKHALLLVQWQKHDGQI